MLTSASLLPGKIVKGKQSEGEPLEIDQLQAPAVEATGPNS